MDKELKVDCPTCKRTFKYYTSQMRPFCSEKCKMIDLGRWFEETYTVEGTNGTVYVEDPEKIAKLNYDL
ncbi:MAG: DNA gyrase inhibitor YacG [Bacteriovoracaceae bacterium]|jgi:endogenous inhibitor of DNA gyrase (YacG/DUF329 family)|nr:DNA gyrase inhibitor YacG [Bacteriovoracaceae bacterium]